MKYSIRPTGHRTHKKPLNLYFQGTKRKVRFFLGPIYMLMRSSIKMYMLKAILPPNVGINWNNRGHAKCQFVGSTNITTYEPPFVGWVGKPIKPCKKVMWNYFPIAWHCRWTRCIPSIVKMGHKSIIVFFHWYEDDNERNIEYNIIILLANITACDIRDRLQDHCRLLSCFRPRL